jgi:phage regulator Rha-like protein
MMDVPHADLLKKLEGRRDRKGYIQILGEGQMSVTDYFIKSTYVTGQNKEMPCYLATKMGCDFLANKFTGEKGILFTAKYVKKFHEMEAAFTPKRPQTYIEALEELLQSEKQKEQLRLELDRSKDWYSIKRVAALNGVDWRTFDWRKLKRTGLDMGYEVKKIFDANYGEVNTYHREVWEAVYPEYEI